MGPHGDVVVNEERLRGALARAESEGILRDEITICSGAPWDAELETFRYAGEKVRRCVGCTKSAESTRYAWREPTMMGGCQSP